MALAMPIDDGAAQKALDALIAALPAATARVSNEMAETVSSAARMELEDPLGPLATSIRTTGPDLTGSFTYRTLTGPTLVYGRQRELGGTIVPKGKTVLTAARRAPGYWTWDFGGGLVDVFSHQVHQVGQHYLRRGLEVALPRLHGIAARVWADVLKVGT